MRSDGELYAGTVSDFSGLDPLIYKDPLRTEQYDFKHLNGKEAAPDFLFFFLSFHILAVASC